MKILIVEHDPFYVGILLAIIKMWVNTTIETVVLSEFPEEEISGKDFKVALVDLDDLSCGLELVTSLRGAGYILGLSRDQDFKDKAMAVGAGFLKKPFKVRELLDLIGPRLGERP